MHARQGMEAYGVRAFAEALEVIPSTLAENAGLNPIDIVTQLRGRHARGETAAGINVRRVRTQPLLLLLVPCLLLRSRAAAAGAMPAASLPCCCCCCCLSTMQSACRH